MHFFTCRRSFWQRLRGSCSETSHKNHGSQRYRLHRRYFCGLKSYLFALILHCRFFKGILTIPTSGIFVSIKPTFWWSIMEFQCSLSKHGFNSERSKEGKTERFLHENMGWWFCGKPGDCPQSSSPWDQRILLHSLPENNSWKIQTTCKKAGFISY